MKFYEIKTILISISCFLLGVLFFKLGQQLDDNGMAYFYTVCLFSYSIINLYEFFSKIKQIKRFTLNCKSILKDLTIGNFKIYNIMRKEVRSIIINIWILNLLTIMLIKLCFIAQYYKIFSSFYYWIIFFIAIIILFIINQFNIIKIFVIVHYHDFKKSNKIILLFYLLSWLFSIIVIYLFPTDVSSIFFDIIEESDSFILLIFIPFYNIYYLITFFISILLFLYLIQDFKYPKSQIHYNINDVGL